MHSQLHLFPTSFLSPHAPNWKINTHFKFKNNNHTTQAAMFGLTRVGSHCNSHSWTNRSGQTNKHGTTQADTGWTRLAVQCCQAVYTEGLPTIWPTELFAVELVVPASFFHAKFHKFEDRHRHRGCDTTQHQRGNMADQKIMLRTKTYSFSLWREGVALFCGALSHKPSACCLSGVVSRSFWIRVSLSWLGKLPLPPPLMW